MSADDDNDNNNIPPQDTPPPPVIESSTGTTEQPQDFAFDEPLEDPEESALNRSGSSLGGGSGKAITFGIVILLGTAIILYYLFSDSPPPPPINEGAVVPTKPSGEIIAQPATAPPAPTGVTPPSVPTAPPAPPPPPPPPAAPAAVKAVNAPPPKPKAPMAPPDIKPIAPAQTAATAAMDKRSAQRMRSNMMLMNQTQEQSSQTQTNAKKALNKNDRNSDFADNAIEASEAETVEATKMDNLNRTIAQGKIVNAILETAINTDLPGTLRAIVSRDVYAEAGREVMIPKGSRLIGTYNTGILRGQRRVMIVWTRVITPNGIDIMIGSPGVDSLGRAGVGGHVDNKYFETFSTAILTSLLTVGVAIAADSGIDGNSTTTTNTDGSTTSSGSAGANAVNSAVRTLGGVGTEVIGGMLDIRPTISVDQGTRINVFVNKDLIMPGEGSSGSMFVQ